MIWQWFEGAMVGAALSQGQSTTLGFATGLFKRFQNPRDKRDFVTAGEAAYSNRDKSLYPQTWWPEYYPNWNCPASLLRQWAWFKDCLCLREKPVLTKSLTNCCIAFQWHARSTENEESLLYSKWALSLLKLCDRLILKLATQSTISNELSARMATARQQKDHYSQVACDIIFKQTENNATV